MRWFVEISSLGQNAQPPRKLCVEAPQWQPALQKARALRGDDGPLSNFSIELLDGGYRAIDPAARLRYLVQRAPDDAALSEGTEGAAAPDALPPLPPMRPPAATVPFISEGLALVKPEPTDHGGGPPRRARAHTIAFSSEGAAEVHAAIKDGASRAAAPPGAPGASPAEAPAGAQPSARSALPEFTVVSRRAEDPSERSPLTYRELVVAVAPRTPRERVEALLLDRYEEMRQALDDVRPGKFIHIAVFDHAFEGRPERKPLATLAWKDWRSDSPEIQLSSHEGAAAPASTPRGHVSPPRSERTPASTAQPESAPGASSERAASSARATSAQPVSSAPRRKAASVPPKIGGRLTGDDLIAELFEACNDLHFLRDSLEGADFILALTLEKIPSAVGLVSLFDINRREFVVVRQLGGEGALLARLPERAPLAGAAMRSRRAVVIPDAQADPRARDDRWKAIGVAPRSLICAPVELAGRTLGLIELADPLDGGRFTDGDGHALTYIGQQFAEFVGARGVIVEPDLVVAGAKKAGR